MTPTPSHPALRAGRRVRAGAAAVAALVALAGLIGGVPWALIRFVGWPLPHRLPAWPDIAAVLTGPMSTGFLLDLLAVLCWVAWAAFVLDVARCTLAALHGTGATQRRRAVRGPVHGLAAVLVGALLVPILTGRLTVGPTVPAPLSTTGAVHRVVAETTEGHPAGRDVPEAVVVRAPDPRTGVHDSLWRIAARALGDGGRWPEIFALNHGKPQPDGGTFDRPSRIFPGEELRLPGRENPPDDTNVNPTGPATSGSSTAPAPPATITAPSSTSTPPTTERAGGVPPAAPTSAPVRTSIPTLRPVPTTAAAPISAAPPSPTRQPQPGPPAAPGLVIGPEAFVGAGLAAAVSAALLLARRRHRRRYRPGSGRRDDVAVAPVVYELRLAHLRAEHDDDPGNWHSGPRGHLPAHVDDGGDVDETPDVADDPRGHDRPAPPGVPPAAPASAPILGVRDGIPAALDLAAVHGLGLVGDGAVPAARAILVHALAEPPGAPGQVIVAASDLTAILGPEPHPSPLPARLQVTATLADALDFLEAETLTRAGQPPPSDARQPALVLIAAVPAQGPDRLRLQAVLDNGSPYGVAGLVLGQWRAGVTAHVRPDGHVTATDPGPGEVLRGARLFHLGADDTADLIALLGQAAPPLELHPPLPDPPATENDAGDEPDPSGSTAAPGPADVDLEVAAGPAENPASSPAGLDTASPATRPPRRHPAGRARPPVRIEVLGSPRVFWRAGTGAGGVAATPSGDTEGGTEPEQGVDEPDGEAARAEVTGLFQPRTRELLVFLTVHPDGATREALTAALWPQSPPERLTNAVNTALSRLRRAVRAATADTLGDVVLTGDGRYRLDPALVETDYIEFADAQAARRGAITEEQRHAAHHAMIAAYTGPLADGLSTEWIETLRESIRRDALDAVAALSRALVVTDPQHTLDLLEIARAFDPHNELLYRDIMRLQARLGLPEAIGRTLDLLTTRLAELGERPTAQTVELATRLRHLEPPPATGTEIHDPGPVPHPGRRAS